MTQFLKNGFYFLYDHLVKHTEESSPQIKLFAIVMMINFPLFGLIWRAEEILSWEEVTFRVIATSLCAFLVSHRFWPNKFFQYLPIIWYVSLLFTLPFFFSYLTLQHHASSIWLMNCVSAVFFLLLVTRVIDALVLLTLGFSLACVSYFYVAHHSFNYIPGDITLSGLLATFIAAIIIGSLFARDREIIHDSRISGMRLLAGSLAHDLRTSLASIHLQAELQNMLVSKLDQPDLQLDLKRSLNKIVRGIEMGNQLISMQLNNIQHKKFDTSNFIIQPIKVLLEKTLQEYPIKEEQQLLIVTHLDHDFSAWIEEVAFKHLIWNLLKNSLDCIEAYGKGEITIWITPGEEADDFNYLNIKDTAKGIYPKLADKIFEKFYTDKKGGTGVGLAYCKLFMKAAGGDIYCKGKHNQYAHFILKFPKID
jgi:signal transduction histidine kinase